MQQLIVCNQKMKIIDIESIDHQLRIFDWIKRIWHNWWQSNIVAPEKSTDHYEYRPNRRLNADKNNDDQQQHLLLFDMDEDDRREMLAVSVLDL